MISVRMRMDIYPRCDRHPSLVMAPVMMQLEPGHHSPWFPAFICPEPNCPRHFNLAYGYFNIFKRRVDPDTNRRMPCPHDSLPMFLAGFEPDGKVWTWRCGQFGCAGMTVEMGATAYVKR